MYTLCLLHMDDLLVQKGKLLIRALSYYLINPTFKDQSTTVQAQLAFKGNAKWHYDLET